MSGRAAFLAPLTAILPSRRRPPSITKVSIRASWWRGSQSRALPDRAGVMPARVLVREGPIIHRTAPRSFLWGTCRLVVGLTDGPICPISHLRRFHELHSHRTEREAA